LDDTCAGRVAGNVAFHGGGDWNTENAFCEQERDAHHAFGASLSRRAVDPLPVELGVAMNDGGDVGDPHEAFPKMFCSVNGDEDELVFKREGRNVAAVNGYSRDALEEIVDRKRAREVTQGALGVELDERRGGRAAEGVLAGSFLGANRSGGDAGLIAGRGHGFGGVANFAAAQKEIDVAIVAGGGISERAHGKYGAFHDRSGNLCVA